MDISKYLTANLASNGSFLTTGKIVEISYPEVGNENTLKFEEDSFWFTHRNNCILYAINKFHVKRTLVDIGGGNGFVSSFLEKNGFETILIEPGSFGAHVASKRGVSTVINGVFQDCGFRENVIPAVGLFDVLEHIEDDVQFLRQILSKIEHSGHLVITVPAHSFLWSNDDVDAGHFRRYSERGLRTVLQKSGFEVVSVSSFFFFLVAPIFLLRAVSSKFGKRTEAETHQKHHSPRKLVRFIVNVFCSLDILMMKAGFKWGASLIAVAQKK